MAIIIEQEKKPVNWFNIIVIAAIIVIVFLVLYFIFFKKPELIDVVVPGSLSSINQLSQVQIDPAPVVNSLNKYFTNNYGASLEIPAPGRSNPFLPI